MAFVGVDPANALRAFGLPLEYAAFEYIIIVRIIGAATLWRVNIQ